MIERTELINVVLVGDYNKSKLFISEALGFSLTQHDPNIIEGKFIINDMSYIKILMDILKTDIEEIDSIVKQAYKKNKCQAVIYIDPSPLERIFGRSLKFNNNHISIEYNDRNVPASECLHQIESFINLREKRLILVLKGNHDQGSVFSLLPKEIATYISSLHFKATSHNYVNSLFKPAPLIPYVEKKEKQAGICINA
jgi:hypothetical protein